MLDLNMQETPHVIPNIPQLSVSEISLKLKSLVEGTFDVVYVRGELTGVKKATSGHVYMAIKDDNAVMDVICWKGTASRLAFALEDGLDVIIQGKITTYPARSKYQIIVQGITLAGEGALLKQLEMLKEKLKQEGLFDTKHKKKIPKLPHTIGVITSQTGAVIRDIIHRLEDRFPCHVILYPATVQGDKAPEDVAKAIKDFTFWQKNPKQSPIPQLDLLIIARGGGSMEDLWCFNSERIARAVFECPIPTISAVGHETDTTLIDYVADLRAPTPTAAAELAVPVRNDLLAASLDLKKRLIQAEQRFLSQQLKRVDLVQKAIKHPDMILTNKTQTLDYITHRLFTTHDAMMKHYDHKLQKTKQTLQHLSINLTAPRDKLRHTTQHLKMLMQGAVKYKTTNWTQQDLQGRLQRAFTRQKQDRNKALEQWRVRLHNMSYQQTLKRGFTLVYQEEELIDSHKKLHKNKGVKILFHDGEVEL